MAQNYPEYCDNKKDLTTLEEFKNIDQKDTIAIGVPVKSFVHFSDVKTEQKISTDQIKKEWNSLTKKQQNQWSYKYTCYDRSGLLHAIHEENAVMFNWIPNLSTFMPRQFINRMQKSEEFQELWQNVPKDGIGELQKYITDWFISLATAENWPQRIIQKDVKKYTNKNIKSLYTLWETAKTDKDIGKLLTLINLFTINNYKFKHIKRGWSGRVGSQCFQRLPFPEIYIDRASWNFVIEHPEITTYNAVWIKDNQRLGDWRSDTSAVSANHGQIPGFPIYRLEPIKVPKTSKPPKALKTSKPPKAPKTFQPKDNECVDMSRYAKYKKRKSPPYPANKCCGEIKKGNDGRKYISKPNVNNVCRWVLYKG